MDKNLDLNALVDGLALVKEEFIKDKKELSVSIRKDVVAIELKAILEKNKEYASLKTAITEYIDNLYKIYGV